MREILQLRPGTLPPSAGSSPSRCARSLVASRSLCVICMAAYTAMLPPLECPPIIMPGDSFAERKRFVLSKIESAYRYADSCDGTGQRTAILKSSFHPTSVPSVPRKAIYSKSGEPQPTSNVIAANCCCSRSLRRSAYSPTRNARKRGDSQTARSNASRYSFISEEFETNISS